jgi:hypothetical protein
MFIPPFVIADSLREKTRMKLIANKLTVTLENVSLLLSFNNKNNQINLNFVLMFGESAIQLKPTASSSNCGAQSTFQWNCGAEAVAVS